MSEQKSETTVFNGMKFYRYPESNDLSSRRYYRAFPVSGESCIYLHRTIWEYNNGTIPDGFEIHHIDENPLNNDVSNLACIPYSMHQSEHSKKWFLDPVNKELSNKHLAEIRPLTKKWHASEEGLAWHKAHARDSINSIPETLHICEFCGNEYMSKATGHNKFCSNSCKSAARRRSKVDDEDRTCIICGKTFRTNKYSTTKTCSRKCGGKRLSNTRREKKMKDNVTQTLLTV